MAIAATHVIQAMLYGATPTDPVTIGAVSLLLASSAVAASWIPARQVSRVDPTESLRME